MPMLLFAYMSKHSSPVVPIKFTKKGPLSWWTRSQIERSQHESNIRSPKGIIPSKCPIGINEIGSMVYSSHVRQSFSSDVHELARHWKLRKAWRFSLK